MAGVRHFVTMTTRRPARKRLLWRSSRLRLLRPAALPFLPPMSTFLEQKQTKETKSGHSFVAFVTFCSHSERG
jgi:hypothetical protein